MLDPLAVIPIYLSIFGDRNQDSHKIALTTAGAVLVTLTIFMFGGTAILHYMGITIPAFKVGGGILIFFMAMDMLGGSMSHFKRSDEEEDYSDVQTIAIVPLAIPLLAGPGAMGTIIVLYNKAETLPNQAGLFGILVILSLLVYIVLRFAQQAQRLFGQTGIRIFTRIMGLLLTAVAVQFIADGLSALFPGLTAAAVTQP